MSNTLDTTLVMLGLSGSGKTNFLVALDVVLDHQTDPDGLVHSDLAADRTYLQPLKEQWLRGEELLHTSRLQSPPPHHLLVRHPKSGASAGLYLPDLAGETFNAQFLTRTYPPDFRDRLKQAGGLLLFLHCDQNADHTILQDPVFIDPQPATAAPSATTEPANEWQLDNTSRQSKLVDLLQFIGEIRPQERPLPVAVTISAWDLVENVGKLGPRMNADIPRDPADFLAIHWPLLNQFLLSHARAFPLRVFGVSARGGGTTPEDIVRLTTFDRPSERILVVDSNHRSNDLTRPIRWLLGLRLDSATPPNA